MSKDNIINNLFRVASNLFTQFSTEEPLISEETQTILNDSKSRQELSSKILDNRKGGKVTVSVEGKDITFFVEG